MGAATVVLFQRLFFRSFLCHSLRFNCSNRGGPLPSFSDMSGRYVLPAGVHNPQQEYDGIASVDCAAGRVMVLVGFFPFGSLPADHPAFSPAPLGPAKNITLSLANVPRCLASS